MSGHNILQQLAREPELEIVDPGDAGTIAVDRSLGICSIVSGSSSETRKIASPARAGIIIAICFGFYLQLVDITQSYEEIAMIILCLLLTIWIIRGKI